MGITDSISRGICSRRTTQMSSQGKSTALTTMVMPAMIHRSALPVAAPSTAPAMPRNTDCIATA
jgi:hypothetical protein